MNKPNLMRVRMRACRAGKAWNEFMEEFYQVIMEGWDTEEARNEMRRLKARGKSLNTLMNKIMKATKQFEKSV